MALALENYIRQILKKCENFMTMLTHATGSKNFGFIRNSIVILFGLFLN